MALTAGGAVMVLVAGAAIITVTLASPGSHAAPVPAAPAAAAPQRDQPAVPLQVLSVTPAAGAKDVNGAAPVRVRFSAPLAASTPMPTLSPHIAGQLAGRGRHSRLHPRGGYFQDTHVTLNIPGGPDGMISVAEARAGAAGCWPRM